MRSGNDNARASHDTTTPSWRNGTGEVNHKAGSIVPEDGFYICTPCGSKKYFKAGTRFKSCLVCFGKEKRLFRKVLELWQKVF